MSEYTPTTETVRERFADRFPRAGYSQALADFDRWLAAHDAEVRAQADAEIRTFREQYIPRLTAAEAELAEVRAGVAKEPEGHDARSQRKTITVPSESALNAAFATGLAPALCDAMWGSGWSLILEPGQLPQWHHPAAQKAAGGEEPEWQYSYVERIGPHADVHERVTFSTREQAQQYLDANADLVDGWNTEVRKRDRKTAGIETRIVHIGEWVPVKQEGADR